MLTRPATITEQATYLETYLGEWATARGGTAKAMANMQHLWEEVQKVTNFPRILICYNGEDARGSFAQQDTLHRVDRKWTVVIMRGHGWKNAMAETGLLGEIPFYDVLEEVRDNLRIVTCISEEFPINYRGMKPLPNLATGRSANVFFDAYSIEFTTANDLAAVVLPV